MEERSRRRLIGAGIVLWLAVQIGVPLARKFEWPSLRYRYRTWSWAMFSRAADRFTVDLYRRDASGRREPIPGLDRFTRAVPAPGMRAAVAYYSRAEMEAWFTDLLHHIAERSDGDWEYVAALSWGSKDHGGARRQELSVPGRRP